MDEQLQQRQQQTTDTIQLRGRETYRLKKAYDRDLFEYRGEMDNARVEETYVQAQNHLQTLQSDAGTTYKIKRLAENNVFNALSAKLNKDKWNWLFFTGKDSPEMVRVKKTLNLVTNLINQNLSEHIKEGDDGAQILDTAELREKLNTALEECMEACDNYARKKREQGGGKYTAGIRRLDLVREVRKRCMEEKLKFGALMDALTEKSGMEHNDLKDMADTSLQMLTSQHLTLTAEEGSSEWQNEGNSTDVYKIKATDGDKTYYIKENLPLISEDISGFLDRRDQQLAFSSDHKDQKGEEKRLHDAKLTQEEYQLARNFIGALKTRITRAHDADRTDVEKRVTSILAHDFDKMFKELDTHNYAADIARTHEKIDWTEILKKTNHQLYGVAVYMKKYREKHQGGEAAGADAAVPQQMTVQQWVAQKLGLNANRDRDILNLLQGKGKEEIKRLFTVSLGKEVELFGQYRERQGSEVKEIAAANNTATYQLAKKMGFLDVVTTAETRVVKFKDRNDQIVERFCTVMEEAKGEEFVKLIQKAEEEKLKIHYTPDAIRQLMRLQAFDIVCNQTDRHGRNFKCEFDVNKENGTLIIKKIKSYDHDNSFGEGRILDLLAGKKNGFLPGMNKILKKDSAEYHYVNKKYFGINKPVWLDQATVPVLRGFKLVRNKMEPVDLSKSDMRNFDPSTSMAKVLVQFHSDYQSPFLTKDSEGEHNWSGPIFKRDKSIAKDQYPDKRNEITDPEEYEEVSTKLGKIHKELNAILNPNRHDTRQENIANLFRTDLTKEEKQDVFRLMGDLHELKEKYDFSALAPKAWIDNAQICSGYSGFLDFWIQNMLYTYANLFREDPEVADLAAGLSEEKYSEEQRNQRKQDMDTLRNEAGDLEIPSLLHFDYDSYEQIRIAANGDDPQMEADLKLLNFSDAKIQAFKQRCKDTLDFLEKAKVKAQAFYRLAGWDKKPQNEFLLKQEDYASITDLSELSVDPGNTYLSVDNEHYLFGQDEFKHYVKTEDVSKAAHDEAEKRHNKRWHQDGYGDAVAAKKKIFANPLASGVLKVA